LPNLDLHGAAFLIDERRQERCSERNGHRWFSVYH